MAAPGQKALGVTAPLSTAPPTPADLKADTDLVSELKRQNNFEGTDETQKRSAVLQSLQRITDEFVKQVSRAQGLPEAFIKNACGRLLTFGSFKLGVIGPGSDIDTLIIAPKHVHTKDFFETFPEILYKYAPEGAITELVPKPDAHAPCMTLKYHGIDLDLLFGRIANLTQIPPNFSRVEDSMLQGLTEPEVRCLNGVRVADEMLSLVPEQAVFRTALRTIKLWSARRAIAGNMYGFPGGVAWAILVARVCQLYPKATGATIVLKFFKIMGQWQWPMPVLLKSIEDLEKGIRIWNPKIYPQDRRHMMPIITPAYPSMCTTHNVTHSTMTVIQRELQRGGKIADKIMDGKEKWQELFTKHTFFTSGYKHYLTVLSASTTKEAQQLWSGFVESRVRILVGRLTEDTAISLAHPFNKGFNRAHRCRSDEEIDAVKSGSLAYYAKDIGTETTGHGLAVGASKDEGVNGDKNSADEENVTMVYTTTDYIGLELDLEILAAKKLDLAWIVDEFKSLCYGWDGYNANTSALHIGNLKR
ncbi:Poly(A) polymeras-like protein [Acephala macrosclerotiorum]|nr:Poly(A) polymeras-like protein [Acephala macrosclerotiorum]